MLGEEAMVRISDAIAQSTNIKEVRFINTRIGITEITILCKGLKLNTTLRILE